MSPAVVSFWAAAALVLYTYGGYARLMRALARLAPRPVRRAPIVPTVTLIVVARDEAARIERRIRNLLELDYPRDRLDLVVVSDGSTDDTVRRAARFEPGVRVLAFPVARGKPAVLNDVVPCARGDIVVLADARQRFAPDAVRALVANFADPAVGAVSGELVLLADPDAAVAADGAADYWDAEKRVRQAESAFDSTVGVTGAIYAFRRALFTPIPAATVLDDVLIPMRIVRRGFRVLFDPAARAYDARAAQSAHEFARKTRTIAGNFQLFGRERWLLDPFRNRLWFQTISHKAFRLILPLAYMTMLAANLALLDRPLYQCTLLGELVCLALACLGAAAPSTARRVAVVRAAYTVGFLTAATVVAFARVVSGRQPVTWQRVPLDAPAVQPAGALTGEAPHDAG
jgi:cellulose synthase/poly-beta-1,6-N-acetylglucosamine synthase-like glycosyltransferase